MYGYFYSFQLVLNNRLIWQHGHAANGHEHLRAFLSWVGLSEPSWAWPSERVLQVSMSGGTLTRSGKVQSTVRAVQRSPRCWRSQRASGGLWLCDGGHSSCCWRSEVNRCGNHENFKMLIWVIGAWSKCSMFWALTSFEPVYLRDCLILSFTKLSNLPHTRLQVVPLVWRNCLI